MERAVVQRASLALLALGLGGCFDFDRVTAVADGADLSVSVDLGGPGDLSNVDAPPITTDGAAPTCVSPPPGHGWQNVSLPFHPAGDIERVAAFGGRIFAVGSGLIAFRDANGWFKAVPGTDWVDRHYHDVAPLGGDGLVVTALPVNTDPAYLVPLALSGSEYAMGAPTSVMNVAGRIDVASLGGTQGMAVAYSTSSFSVRFDASLTVTGMPSLPNRPANVVAFNGAFYSCGYDFIARFNAASSQWDAALIPPTNIFPMHYTCTHMEIVEKQGAARYWLTIIDEMSSQLEVCVVDDGSPPTWRCKSYPLTAPAVVGGAVFPSPCDPELAIAIGAAGTLAFVDGTATTTASESLPASGDVYGALILASGAVYAVGASNLLAERAP